MSSTAELLRKYADILSENPAMLGAPAAPAAPAMPGTTPAPTPTASNVQQTGQPQGGLDPRQAAVTAKQMQDQKKELQDQIKQTEQQLMDLRKKLAELG
jgi:hypothetical protein